ncbi:MAG TPA: FTR1 family protein [Xanthomonadaceae bacterium]|jgi:high-affinity iron transporter
MLANFLIVLREVLEAALIVGIVAAATRGVAARGRWIGGGIALGVLGAVLVAVSAGRLAEALDGSGQEWFNAGVLLAAVGMIGWHVVWMSKHGRELSQQMQAVGRDVSSGARPMTALMTVIAIAVLREGSEIVLFGYGLMASGSSVSALATGAALGLLCGVGLGFAIYFGLLKIPLRHFFSATNGLLVFLAAGMAANAAAFLTQADVLSTWTTPLWNTGWLLGDDSLTGKTVHVLTGYTAEPTGMQLLFYLSTLALLVAGMRLVARHAARARPTAPSVAAA